MTTPSQMQMMNKFTEFPNSAKQKQNNLLEQGQLPVLGHKVELKKKQFTNIAQAKLGISPS